MRNQKDKLPIQVEVPFKETLSKDQLCYAVIELVKSLTFQRRQIPQTIDSLRRELR